jgi:hypothetical protein
VNRGVEILVLNFTAAFQVGQRLALAPDLTLSRDDTASADQITAFLVAGFEVELR